MYSTLGAGAKPAHRPVGPGLQMFGLITPACNRLCIVGGELKSVRAQSVGEVSAC